jgi:hypothetical protein
VEHVWYWLNGVNKKTATQIFGGDYMLCWANWLTRNDNKALVKAPCRLDSVMVCAEKRGGKTKKKVH